MALADRHRCGDAVRHWIHQYAIGQSFWTKALQLAPAPAVTPFYYLMFVSALMFGFFIWGRIPSAGLLVGSAIVVMTGLFLFLREARLQRQLAAR